MKVMKMLLSLCLLMFGWTIITVQGQSDRGSIRGTVTDPNGGLIANAKVTITNVETNETRETITSGEGSYNIPELKAAVYRIQVEASGFKSATIDTVQVGVGIIRNGDVKLEIGVGASVTVTAEPSVLNTESPVQQRNVTEREVRELPLLVSSESGGRSPLSFIFLDSSVVGSGSDNTAGQTGGGASSAGINGTNFRINGSQGLGQEILIDGAGTRRGENGTFFSEVAPGPNVFQEFTINTSNYSAEFGNSSGGVISFKIKEGGNDFHGEGYFFHRNESLNANNTRNRLLNTTLPANQQFQRPFDRQRDYGFSVSGPVFLPRFGEGTPYFYNGRNKTFFFFNYSAYSISQSETVDVSVPTLRMRNGDFGELLTDPYILQFFGPGGVRIFNPNETPGSRTAFTNNIIPPNLISRVGRNFANLFPLPNQTGPLGSGVFHNYRATSSAGSQTQAYTTKINQVLSDKQQINGSFVYRTLPSTKGGFPRLPGDFVNQGVWDQAFKSYYLRIQYDYTLTNNILNHLNLGFNRTKVQNFNFGRGAGRATALGVPVGTTQDLGLPMVGFPGYGDPVISTDPRAYQTGGSTFFDNVTSDNTYEVSDFVSYTRGRHTFRFGGDFRRQYLIADGHFDIGGQFNFRSGQTANVNDFNEGYPIASL
ncbi:MAG: carboxypeptidase-like regulatory domain-containing protein, partial [Actinomycetota bacterium]